MLRKIDKKSKYQLELRHQRTSDAFFGIYSEKNPLCKITFHHFKLFMTSFIFENKILETDKYNSEIVYKMIETLLPKANYIKESK